MKRLWFACTALVLVILVSSCKKEDIEGATTDSTTATTASEKDKANLEKSGIDFVNNMEEMRTNSGMETFSYLVGDLFANDDPVGDSVNSRYGRQEEDPYNESPYYKSYGSLKSLQAFTEGETGLVELAGSMKNAANNTPESVELWNALVGTYTWNPIDTAWDYTAEGTTVKFLFPSSETAVSNDAVFEITTYQAQMNFVDVDSLEYEGPVAMEWHISVDGTKLVDYVFSASYQDGMPVSVHSELTASPFSFVVAANNTNNQSASFEYTLKNGALTIIGYGGGASGNWTETNINNNTYELMDISEYSYCDDYGYDPDTYESYCISYTSEYDTSSWDSVAIDKIVYEANLYAVIMDVKIAGVVDFENLYSQIMTIQNNTALTEEQSMNQVAQAVNQYVDLDVRYESTNKLVAEMEAYPILVEDEYCEWDYSQGMEVCEPDEYYSIDMRMVFPDGSKVDMETYFETGFTSLVDELNLFMTDMAEEFDFAYTPIEY